MEVSIYLASKESEPNMHPRFRSMVVAAHSLWQRLSSSDRPNAVHQQMIEHKFGLFFRCGVSEFAAETRSQSATRSSQGHGQVWEVCDISHQPGPGTFSHSQFPARWQNSRVRRKTPVSHPPNCRVHRRETPADRGHGVCTMRCLPTLILLFLFVSLGAAEPTTVSFVVATNGDDANPGTVQAPPCASTTLKKTAKPGRTTPSNHPRRIHRAQPGRPRLDPRRPSQKTGPLPRHNKGE